jgi:RimJ/RimL family protein N-acetyltransferase
VTVLPVSFTTPRLRAEPLRAGDFAELRRMHSDPTVMQHLGGVRSDQQTRDYHDINLRHWQTHGFGLWILYEREGDEPIGRGLLRYLRVDGVDELEIGYAFYEPFWGQGLATEIAAGCMDYGRKHLQGRRFFALVSPDNVASRRVLEKAGLRYDRDYVLDEVTHALFRTIDGRERRE